MTTAFRQYAQRHDIDVDPLPGEGYSEPSTPQIIVLPPRSRFEPANQALKPHPALQETIIEDVTNQPPPKDPLQNEPSRPRSGASGNSGRAMSPPAQPRQAFVSTANSPRSRPDGAVRALNGTLVPTRSRPTSAASTYRNAYYMPPPSGGGGGGKRRPGSARPGTAASDGSGAGGRDVYALWTPGEAVLTGPSLSATAPHSARRPASEELQYELSVTASVLRAAQTRLGRRRRRQH